MTIYRKGNAKDEAALQKAAMKEIDAKEKRAAKTPESKKLPNSAGVFVKRNADGKTTATTYDENANQVPYEGPISSLNNMQWTKIMQNSQDKRTDSQFK
jgi:hypothetical protein